MTTRTFNTPEELMIALLQGEKWEMTEPFTGVCYYDDLNKKEPFRFVDNFRDGYINRAYEYCDGETLWYKVEEKPKKKIVTIIKFYSAKGKVLEMDKSKLTQMPKNIIDEYEIEVYDE